MRTRCNNPRRGDWEYYGGRGIRICSQWDDFEVFLADMGERPPGTTLDRRDTDGDYTPENCRWLPLEQQSANRRSAKLSEADCVLIKELRAAGSSLQELSERFGVTKPMVSGNAKGTRPTVRSKL
jgi:hypothetical protein